ncbi:hypothetical protein FRC02_003512 [Tulasnella sp. 418]|nr:hypothetical protein FRC02_003512 [Tulasnella sp. 418]
MTSRQPSEETILKALDLLVQDVRSNSGSNSDASDHTGEVKDIDSEIQALIAVSITLQRVIEEQLVRHRRRRNSIASALLRCPDEIISEIFLYLVENTSTRRRYQHIHNLQLVCSRFYHIFDTTTRLWACIDSGLLACEGITNPSCLIDLSLRKSKNAPLDIKIGFHAASPSGALWLLDKVAPHFHRWRSFYSSLFPDPRIGSSSLQEIEEPLRRLCMMKAPQLRKFNVSSMKGHNLFEPSKLFDDFAPCLQWLSIIGMPISWDSLILSGLTELSLSAWNGTSPPTVDQYLRVLLSCPMLEELMIVGREIDCTRDELAAVFHHSIPLPNLNQLILDILHPWTIRSLLSSIKADPKELRTTFGGIATQQCVDIVESIFHNPHAQHYLQAVHIPERTIYLQLSRNSSGVSFESNMDVKRHESFTCTFEGVMTPIPLYRALLPPSSRAMIRDLYLNAPVGRSSFTEDFGPRELFTELVDLRELTVVEDDPWVTLVPLSKPVSEAHSGGRWLCPHLHELRIEFGFFSINNLWQFLESRYNNNDPPTSLSRLGVFWNEYYEEMADIPIDIASKVVQLVGMGVFSWDNRAFQAEEGKWVRMH